MSIITIPLIPFIDAQQMARDFPETFQAPDEEMLLLGALKPGDSVKVNPDSERFWVTVSSIDGEKVTGVIDNDLVYEYYHGLQYGDTVVFFKRHIYDVLPFALRQ